MSAAHTQGVVMAHLDGEPWPAIRNAVASARGRVAAAVGYLGDGAHDWLPLSSGDLLVCDASDRAVRNGSTNPRVLSVFLRAGVELWSEEGLHAKVVVLPRRAFVGSANASNHSAMGMIEAVVETTDTRTVRELREFVESRGIRPVVDEDVERLISMMPTRQRPVPTARRPLALPDPLTHLVLLGIRFVNWNAAEQRAHDERLNEARRRSRRRGTRALLDPVSVSKWVYDRVNIGDWVAQYDDDGELHSPGEVVDFSAHGLAHIIWLARPMVESIKITDAESRGVPAVDKMKHLSGQSADDVCAMFRTIQDASV